MLKSADTTPVLPYPRDMKLAGGVVRVLSLSPRADHKLARRAVAAFKRGLKSLAIPVAEDGYPVSVVVLEEADRAWDQSFTASRSSARGRSWPPRPTPGCITECRRCCSS